VSCDLCPTRTTCLRVVRPLRPLSVSHDLFSTSFCVVRPLSSIDLFPFRTTSFRPLSVPCDLFPRLTSFRLARPLSDLFLCRATSFLDRPLSVSCDLFPRSTSFHFARPLSDLFPCHTTSLLDRPLSDSHDLSPTSFYSLHDLVWRSCCFLPSSDNLCPTLSSECCFLLFLVGVCSFFVRSFSSVTTPSQVTSSYKLACVLLCFCSILCGVQVEGSGESYKFEIERFSKAPIHPPLVALFRSFNWYRSWLRITPLAMKTDGNGRKNLLSTSVSIFVGGNRIRFGKCGFGKWNRDMRVHGNEPIRTKIERKWSEAGNLSRNTALF
jgi:hypothetical protein